MTDTDKKVVLNKDGTPTKRKYVTANGKATNLPPKNIAGFKDPEIQKKAQEGKLRYYANKRKRKEALEWGFEGSKLATPDNQRQLLDKMFDYAMTDGHELQKMALDILVKHGAFKLPEEKAKQVEEKKPEVSAEDAIAILKSKGF